MTEQNYTREELEDGMYDALIELKELLEGEIAIGVEKMVHAPGAKCPFEFQQPDENAEATEEGGTGVKTHLGVGELIMATREPLSATDKHITIPRIQELITEMAVFAFEYTHNPLTEGRSTSLIWHPKEDLLIVRYEGMAAVKIDFSNVADEEEDDIGF